MKIEWNKKYTTVAVYTLIVLAAGVVIYQILNNFTYVRGALGVFGKIMLPFVYGFAIAYILNPVLKWFEGKAFPWLGRGKLSRRACRYLGVACTIVVGLLVIGFFVGIVIPQLAVSIANVLSNITEYAAIIQDVVVSFTSRFKNSEVFLPIVQSLIDYVEDIVRAFMDMLSKSLGGIINTTISTTIQITSTIINFFVGFIIAIYIWISKETFFAQLRKLMHAFLSENAIERLTALSDTANRVFSRFIIGKIIDSLIIGVICYLGMRILRIPFALLISVIVCVTNVIPYFGPFIGAIPSILLLLFTNPIKGLWFTVFIILLQQVDGNIIGPKILGESTGLSAFWVIFAVTIFGGLFGFVGMIIGVPLFAVIYAIVKEGSEARLRRKNLATETAAYATSENPLLPTNASKGKRGEK